MVCVEGFEGVLLVGFVIIRMWFEEVVIIEKEECVDEVWFIIILMFLI